MYENKPFFLRKKDLLNFVGLFDPELCFSAVEAFDMRENSLLIFPQNRFSSVIVSEFYLMLRRYNAPSEVVTNPHLKLVGTAKRRRTTTRTTAADVQFHVWYLLVHGWCYYRSDDHSWRRGWLYWPRSCCAYDPTYSRRLGWLRVGAMAIWFTSNSGVLAASVYVVNGHVLSCTMVKRISI